MERLGDLIEQEITGQEAQRAEMENRFVQKVEALLEGAASRPPAPQGARMSAQQPALAAEEQAIRADAEGEEGTPGEGSHASGRSLPKGPEPLS